MFKRVIKQLAIIFCTSICLLILVSTFAAVAQASGQHAHGTPQVSLAQQGRQNPTGHPGTSVTITGKSFTPNGTVNIYTTADNGQCTAGGQGLQPLTGKPQVTVKADGTFQFTVAWPDNANTVNTPYYICAISTTTPNEMAVSTASFTVAPEVTASLSAGSVNAGGKVTVTGDNWLPPQQLTVSIIPNPNTGQAATIASQNVTSDDNGHFTVDLTIDAQAQAGTYTLSVIAMNEPTLKYVKTDVLAVNAAPTPTPTPTAAPTPTVTPTPTPTATPGPTATPTPSGNNGGTNNGNGGGGSGGTSTTTILIYTLGGSGILLVVVGLIMFAVSAPPRPAR